MLCKISSSVSISWLMKALYRSDIIQNKSTEVPRMCIFKQDGFPHLIGDLSDVYRCTMVSKSCGKIEVVFLSFICNQ
jgi:hypothetical protein